MSSNFDPLAAEYTYAFTLDPQEFINLLERKLNLKVDDVILDIGCGSGFLTLPLSEISDNVEGLDLSKNMLSIASSRDILGKILWIQADVGTFDLGQNKYKLVLSFEAFHLFNDQRQLVQRIFQSLIPGGYFLVGWTEFFWESCLYKVIERCFYDVGLVWGPSYNPAIMDIPTLVKEDKDIISEPREMSVRVWDVTRVTSIAKFLSNINITQDLPIGHRRKLENNLINCISEYTQYNILSGHTYLKAQYVQRV